MQGHLGGFIKWQVIVYYLLAAQYNLNTPVLGLPTNTYLGSNEHCVGQSLGQRFYVWNQFTFLKYDI